jgi:hypothetical protein
VTVERQIIIGIGPIYYGINVSDYVSCAIRHLNEQRPDSSFGEKRLFSHFEGERPGAQVSLDTLQVVAKRQTVNQILW